MGYERGNGFDEAWTFFVYIVFLLVLGIAGVIHGLGRPIVRLFGGSAAVSRWDEAFTLD